MMSEKWSDLRVRIASAIVMLLIFAVCLWGGPTFLTALMYVCAIAVIWELAAMAGVSGAIRYVLMGLAAICWLPLILMPDRFSVLEMALPLIAVAYAPIIIAASVARRHAILLLLYGALTTLGLVGLAVVITEGGTLVLLSVVGVVVISDTAGYFAGRLIGGPKFWPKISPKKTWSGTIAGWVGAAIFALVIIALTDSPSYLVLVFVLLAFAAQMGDIAESAVKRRLGVKDSSNLIPGHGGVLDRFDGMLGAGVVAILIVWFIPIL